MTKFKLDWLNSSCSFKILDRNSLTNVKGGRIFDPSLLFLGRELPTVSECEARYKKALDAIFASGVASAGPYIGMDCNYVLTEAHKNRPVDPRWSKYHI